MTARDATSALANGVAPRPIKLFVRQGFTQTGPAEVPIVQQVLDVLEGIESDGRPLSLLTGRRALGSDDFQQDFERTTGASFSPRRFRDHRLGLIDAADAILVIRTGLSESGAFEVAYNVFGGRRAPMFFAVWEGAPMKTTLLRDLDELVPSVYTVFRRPEDLAGPLRDFLDDVARSR